MYLSINNGYFMASGIELVNRIDEVLLELGISRREFAASINIQPNTMGNWKTNNSMPPLETVEIIAEKLNVSPDWLLFGDKYTSEFDKRTGYFSRTQVGARIDSCLRDRTNTTPSDVPTRDIFNQELGHIISHEKFANWLLGRYNIDLIVFQKIASELTTSIQYLLTDLHAKVPEDFDPVLFNEAKENANSVHCLYNLSDDKKQIVSDMLNKLMELEHLEHVSKK